MNRFVIISEVRSGYQMIALSLNLHPDITCLGEIFGCDRNVRQQSLFNENIPVYEEQDDPGKYLERITQMLHCGSFGFKLNYEDDIRLPNLWSIKSYLRDAGWKIIHLTRENMLDRLMSMRLSWQEQTWQNEEYSSKVHIEPQHFIETTINSWRNREFVDKFFNKSELIKVWYEEASSNINEEMNRIQKFVGCNPVDLKIVTKKQMKKSQFYHIENFKNLYEHFNENEFLRKNYLHFFQQLKML